MIQQDEILATIKELFGSDGDNPSVAHNFHCDFGCNIHVGNNFYAGYNCTMLDYAEIRIGNNCLIGPDVGIYTTYHDEQPEDTIILLNIFFFVKNTFYERTFKIK